MSISGYNEYERVTAIKGAIDRVSKMKQDIKNGLRDTLHRDGRMIRQAKRDKKDWSNTFVFERQYNWNNSLSHNARGHTHKEPNKEHKSKQT